MSQQCKLNSVELQTLDPFFVEIFKPGALRRIRPDEVKKAQGMCFLCPRCKPDKKKKHYLVLLFTSAPEKARPQGRFQAELNHYNQLLKMHEQTIHEVDHTGSMRTLLRPQDVCGWEGYVMNGRVSWRPSFVERHGKM